MILAMIHGAPGLLAELPSSLRAAGLDLVDAPPAAILINLGGPADPAISASHAFASNLAPGQGGLVVNMLHAHRADDWQQAREAATLWAFTRYAALAWAPRGIRVNALGLAISPHAPSQPMQSAAQAAAACPCAPANEHDVAATVLAFWRLQSMTGQIIRLGSLAA